MCRITGFLDKDYQNNYNIDETIKAMRDTLIAGGPDDAGLYTEINKKGVALGHRRLSIIDLSSWGHQPMTEETKRFWLVYNGEIYNFKEIQKELLQKGYSFNSSSDTEVLLKSYQAWGIEAVHKFRGMFAFAIWDTDQKKLILCRDRVGVKPLYWYLVDNLFMFASELKAFHKHPFFKKEINSEALSSFLSYGYISAPLTIYKNTYKLEPGFFMIIDENLNIEKKSYWNIYDIYKKGTKTKLSAAFSKDKKETMAQTENLLKESFKLRMVSDVPVGVFLSGGIDSSLLVALLAQENYNLKTFTIGFLNEKFNEATVAKEIASRFKTDHTELYFTEEEALKIIPKIPEIYDEPFGDTSALPTFLLTNLAKQKVKVGLSADGGDELFCGYWRYWTVAEKFFPLYNSKIKRKLINIFLVNNPTLSAKAFSKLFPQYKDWLDKLKKIKNLFSSKNFNQFYNNFNRFYLNQDLFQLGLKENNLFEESCQDLDLYEQMMLWDFRHYLPEDILTKVDRASMHVSLEAREPFLDHKLIEYLAVLPSSYKYSNGVSKYILKKILSKYLPQEMINRPKKGFAAPVGSWMKSSLKEMTLDYLAPKRLKEQAILNDNFVSQYVDNFYKGLGINEQKIWLLLIFQLWHEKWM